jgi:putative flippase GtrA
VAAALDFFFFALFAKLLGYNYFVVGAIGFVLATTLNYLLSIVFVFESGVRFKSHTEFSLVFLVSLVGLILNQMILFLGIGWLEWEMLLVKIMATGSVFFWNYGARSRFVFKPRATEREID